MKQKNQLYTLALALLMATTFQACDNNELTPADVKPEGKVPLKVGLNIDGWKGDASGTRAEREVGVTLLDGGEIIVQIAEYKENGTEPDFPNMLGNAFTVKDGKLERLPYNKEDLNQTEADIAIRKSGDYFVDSGGFLRLTSDGVTYKVWVNSVDEVCDKIAINIDAASNSASLEIPYIISSAGLRLIAKDADGNPYSGSDDIIATLPTLKPSRESDSFESQTLNAGQRTAIWGNLDNSEITAGTQLLQLKVGEKIYKVNAPRDITFELSYLYTFNVRVGATSIIVSSDALGIDDFVVQGTTNADALPQS